MRPSYPPQATHSGCPPDTQAQGGPYPQGTNKRRAAPKPPQEVVGTKPPQYIGGPTRGIVPNLPNPLRRPGDIVPVPHSSCPQIPIAKVQSPLSSPGEFKVKVVLMWSKERPTLEREITFFDSSSQDPLTLLWTEDKALYQGNGSLSVGTHCGTLLFPTTGEMLPVQQFEVVRKQMGMGMIKLKLHEQYVQAEPAREDTVATGVGDRNEHVTKLGLEMKERDRIIEEMKQDIEALKEEIHIANNLILNLKRTALAIEEHHKSSIEKIENGNKGLRDIVNIQNKQISQQNKQITATRVAQVDKEKCLSLLENIDKQITDLEILTIHLQEKEKSYQILERRTTATPGATFYDFTPDIIPGPNKTGKLFSELLLRTATHVNVVKLKSQPNPREYQGTQAILSINNRYELGVIMVICDKTVRIGYRKGSSKYVGIKLNNPVGNSSGEFRTKRYFECEPHCAIFAPLEDVLIPVAEDETNDIPHRIEAADLPFPISKVLRKVVTTLRSELISCKNELTPRREFIITQRKSIHNDLNLFNASIHSTHTSAKHPAIRKEPFQKLVEDGTSMWRPMCEQKLEIESTKSKPTLCITPDASYKGLTPQIVPVVNKTGKPTTKLLLRSATHVNAVKLNSLPNPQEYKGKQAILLINKHYELGVIMVVFEMPGKVGVKSVSPKYVGIKLNNPVGNSGGELLAKSYFENEPNCAIFAPLEGVLIPVAKDKTNDIPHSIEASNMPFPISEVPGKVITPLRSELISCKNELPTSSESIATQPGSIHDHGDLFNASIHSTDALAKHPAIRKEPVQKLVEDGTSMQRPMCEQKLEIESTESKPTLCITPDATFNDLTPQIVPVANKTGKPATKSLLRSNTHVNAVKLKSLPNPLEYQGRQAILSINRHYELGVIMVIFELPGKVDLGSVSPKYVGIKLNNPVGNSSGEFRTKRYFECEPNSAIFAPFEDVLIPVIKDKTNDIPRRIEAPNVPFPSSEVPRKQITTLSLDHVTCKNDLSPSTGFNATELESIYDNGILFKDSLSINPSNQSREQKASALSIHNENCIKEWRKDMERIPIGNTILAHRHQSAYQDALVICKTINSETNNSFVCSKEEYIMAKLLIIFKCDREWYAGVRLFSPLGKSDGIFHGKYYFKCEPCHALFVPLDNIFLTEIQKDSISNSKTSSEKLYI